MRPVSIEDYDALKILWLNCEGMGLNNIDDSKEGIAKYLERNPSSCFVEERDGQIVGVVLSGHDGRRGSLHHLAVAKPYRHQGIGTALTQAAIDSLKNQGIIRVALFVFTDNTEGKAFWEKRGFRLRNDIEYMDKDLVEIKSLSDKNS